VIAVSIGAQLGSPQTTSRTEMSAWDRIASGTNSMHHCSIRLHASRFRLAARASSEACEADFGMNIFEIKNTGSEFTCQMVASGISPTTKLTPLIIAAILRGKIKH